MKRIWMIIFVMCLMSSWVAAEAHAKPQSMIWTRADFTVPEGWSEYEETILGEPVLTLSRGLYTIGVYLFSGPDSGQFRRARLEGVLEKLHTEIKV